MLAVLQIDGRISPLFQIYQGWYMANNQELFLFPEEHKRILDASAPTILEMGRAMYFNTMLPLVMGIRV
jgi:hypothetical protein